MINNIWENIIIPVSRKTNIVIPRLKMSRKNTIPRRLMTCGIVRLSLSLSSISVSHHVLTGRPVVGRRTGRYQSFHTVSSDFFYIAVSKLQEVATAVVPVWRTGCPLSSPRCLFPYYRCRGALSLSPNPAKRYLYHWEKSFIFLM